MRHRILAVCFALVLAAPIAAAGGLSGTWTARRSDHRNGWLDLSLQTGRHDNQGTQLDRRAFEGLGDAQIESPTRVPVQFELSREAGRATFEGTFRNGVGTGEFTFTPNPDYPRMLRSVGVTFEPSDDPDRQLFNLALFDVSIAFIRSMQAIGYRVPLQKYVEFRIFDVNPDYVRGMASVGYDHLSADRLVETRIHGATPDYIRTMRAHGEDLTLDQYIESRIFQVTPEFADEMRRAGYPDLPRDMLVQFRIHGVTTDFIRDLRELGYSRVPADKLVEMRIHGVTPEFIRRVDKAGYHHVPTDKLVQMRIFDIDPEMVKALDADDR